MLDYIFGAWPWNNGLEKEGQRDGNKMEKVKVLGEQGDGQ